MDRLKCTPCSFVMLNTNQSSLVYTHLVLVSFSAKEKLLKNKNSLLLAGSLVLMFSCVKQQQQISSSATFRRAESFLTCVAKYVPEGWLFNSVYRRKLNFFAHMKRHDSLEKAVLKGQVHGKRSRDRQRRRWEDCISERFGYTTN